MSTRSTRGQCEKYVKYHINRVRIVSKMVDQPLLETLSHVSSSVNVSVDPFLMSLGQGDMAVPQLL